MLTIAQLRNIVNHIRFNDWDFMVGTMGDGFYVQIQFLARDNDAPHTPVDPAPMLIQRGRKWYVSKHMTESEVVQTLLKAVLAAVEHEAREQFTYKGKQLFGPHLDVEALMEIAERTVYREPVAA